MIIAQKLKEQNVAEYLLYMWQVEDLLRSVALDVDKLEDSYLSRFQLEGEQRAELRRWYDDLAEMMRSEGVAQTGHLQICKNVLIWLDDLHARLMKSTKFPYYSAAYYKALPFIVELRQKSGTQNRSELENCFDALYGLMLLRLQGKPVSEETKKAMDSISTFIGMLSDYYKKEKEEGLDL